jgi:hypothetical protein
MPISREGKFLITRDLGHTLHIGLESSALPACIAEAKRAGYKGVFGSPVFGFNEQNLECLRELPDLESLWFWDIRLNDVDAVYSLSRLQMLGIHPRRPPLDFSRLPSLRELVLNPLPRDSGVQDLQALDVLHIWHFQPKTKSFADLQIPSNLRELKLNWANPEVIQGLRALPSLKRLEIHRCRNLRSLAGLSDLYPNLEHLVVAACGRIISSQERAHVSRLPHLKHAFIQDSRVL